MAVIGAGVTGLAAAIRLAENGWRVSVLEPAATVGGLAGGFHLSGACIERYYHHIFPSDQVARRWIAEMGLSDDLGFLPATMGFYTAGRLHRFGTLASLLRFTPLPVRDRVRLGLRIRQLARSAAPDAYEDVTALAWLRDRASEAEMRVFWKPLLMSKFGADAGRVSMAWLWARFRARMGGSPLSGERLGYLRGSFQRLADRMAERARECGAELHLGSRCVGVRVRDGAIAGVSTTTRGDVPVDAVVWTPSLNLLSQVVPDLDPVEHRTCRETAYHGAVVAVVELPSSAIPFYWLTIADDELPFTVAVEHTRLVGTAEYGGRTIVYLGRYVPPDDPWMVLDETALLSTLLDAASSTLSPMFAHACSAHVFRAHGAQPITPPGWGRARLPLLTSLHGLVAANIAQIYPWDRGINYSLQLGEQAAMALVGAGAVAGAATRATAGV